MPKNARKTVSVITLTIGLLLLIVYPSFQSIVARSGGFIVSCIRMESHLNVSIAAFVIILGSFIMLYSCTAREEKEIAEDIEQLRKKYGGK